MATYSSILAWKIPQTEEPGGQRSKAVTKSRTRLSDCITTTIYQRDSTAQVLVRNTKLFLGLSYK